MADAFTILNVYHSSVSLYVSFYPTVVSVSGVTWNTFVIESENTLHMITSAWNVQFNYATDFCKSGPYLLSRITVKWRFYLIARLKLFYNNKIQIQSRPMVDVSMIKPSKHWNCFHYISSYLINITFLFLQGPRWVIMVIQFSRTRYIQL